MYRLYIYVEKPLQVKLVSLIIINFCICACVLVCVPVPNFKILIFVISSSHVSELHLQKICSVDRLLVHKFRFVYLFQWYFMFTETTYESWFVKSLFNVSVSEICICCVLSVIPSSFRYEPKCSIFT